MLRRLEYFSDFTEQREQSPFVFTMYKSLKKRISHKIPSNTVNSLQQGFPVFNGSQSITVETMKKAEVQIIKAVQTSHFQGELKALSTVQTLENLKDKTTNSRKKYVLKSCSPLVKPFLGLQWNLASWGVFKTGKHVRYYQVPKFWRWRNAWNNW